MPSELRRSSPDNHMRTASDPPEPSKLLKEKIMKKTLVAMAVLGAFAGSSFAADVTLYGVLDEGVKYTHFDADQAGVDATDTVELKSGNQAGSRWG